jgi:hypothetical protein
MNGNLNFRRSLKSKGTPSSFFFEVMNRIIVDTYVVRVYVQGNIRFKLNFKYVVNVHWNVFFYSSTRHFCSCANVSVKKKKNNPLVFPRNYSSVTSNLRQPYLKLFYRCAEHQRAWTESWHAGGHVILNIMHNHQSQHYSLVISYAVPQLCPVMWHTVQPKTTTSSIYQGSSPVDLCIMFRFSLHFYPYMWHTGKR